MPEQPEEEPVLITSQLWKSARLAESNYLPQMVRAAAYATGKTYTQDMTNFVASYPQIVGAIALPVNEGMDAVLAQFATDPVHGATMDQLIIEAVNAYQPPPAEPTPPAG